MSYAIISLGGKQYRVSEGQRLLVDRIALDDGATFTPPVLLVGGEGGPQVSPDGVTVTARVVGQQRGPKIRIGKLKRRTGYRRHTGFRAALTQVEIESIGGANAARSKPAGAPASGEEPEPRRSRTAKPAAAAEPEGGAAGEES